MCVLGFCFWKVLCQMSSKLSLISRYWTGTVLNEFFFKLTSSKLDVVKEQDRDSERKCRKSYGWIHLKGTQYRLFYRTVLVFGEGGTWKELRVYLVAASPAAGVTAAGPWLHHWGPGLGLVQTCWSGIWPFLHTVWQSREPPDWSEDPFLLYVVQWLWVEWLHANEFLECGRYNHAACSHWSF